ncbi:MAG: YceD family protein [Roseinatronobacter sp.]
MSDSPSHISLIAPLRVARLTARRTHEVTLEPDAGQRQQIAGLLGIEALRKFRFSGTLRPLDRTDWELRADLGATVVQLCAVTLAPVTTRIDEPVIRRFIADLPEPDGLEVEMPQDDTLEPLGAEIDISAIAIEALSLALPAFPRAPDAELSPTGTLDSAPPGATPLPESRPNPFAALAVLKGKLPDPDGTPPESQD